jgi:MerR family transcriptional regulator, thiopeptide resistance regulator
VADAMGAGHAADSPQVMDLAEEHRSQISRWFYDCSYEIHRGLAEMYVADQRLTATIDGYGDGVAAYLREAILANAARRAD